MTTPEARVTPEGRILAFPRSPRLASEYDESYPGWNFDIRGAEPHVRSAVQALTQLLVDPQNWVVEAHKVERDAWNRKAHFSISYVFYSPSRERPNFSTKNLFLDLKEIVKPEILEKYYNGGVTDTRRQTHRWVNLRPPFPTVTDPQNPISSYMVDKVTLRDFNLYLKYSLTKEGIRDFDGPAFDPRRFVAELIVEDPIVALRLLIDGSIGQIGQYLQKNRGRLPTQILTRADKILATIKELEHRI